MTRFYHGLDIRDLWRGRLTWRRLGVLIRGLPVESLTRTAIRNETPVTALRSQSSDADYGPWTQTDMLLAELIDLTRWLQWAKTKSGQENRDHPKPFPRPGIDREIAPLAKVVNLLEYVRAHDGAAPQDYAVISEETR